MDHRLAQALDALLRFGAVEMRQLLDRQARLGLLDETDDHAAGGATR